MKALYLDWAATTPVDPAVQAAMEPYLTEQFGNPNSLHSFGQAAQAAQDRAREALAKAIGARFREIIFTGSATEANNLALRGTVKQFQIANLKAQNKKPKIIISAIEHESVLETARDLGRDGVEVVEIPVDSSGVIDLKKLEAALDERTVLVSVMYASNEIGTVQPIPEIAGIIREFRDSLNPKPDTLYPLFHTDAVQAFAYLGCDVENLGVDLMTLSAHKICGPKGAGILYRKDLGADHNYLASILTGGGQEFGLRAGTQNVAGIVGFAVAAERATHVRAEEIERMAALGNLFWTELSKKITGVILNGVPPEVRRTGAVPNIWSVSFPRHCARDLVVRLDMAGVAVSAGAACSSRSPKESYVLAALGISKERVANGVRFSFGQGTTEADIREAVARIAAAVTE
jgi:cysteine desulfurase